MSIDDELKAIVLENAKALKETDIPPQKSRHF